MPDRAAIGFCAHTGWAASVVIAGPLSQPQVVDRRRIRLVDSDDTVDAEAYHQAAKLDGAAAERFVREAAESAAARALAALRALSEELAGSHRLVAAGIAAGGGKLPRELTAILRSHAFIHTAEGELYRGALSAGASGCGLAVIRIPRRDLQDRLASMLRTDGTGAKECLAKMGRALGPPWAQDQKEAAMAALLALASGSPPPVTAKADTPRVSKPRRRRRY